MANEYSEEVSGTSHVSGEGSDATVELNIKTLDSQIYSFQVHKNMPVSIFKEKIANEIGVPVSQQRLIFRGRVLKDEHLLSEYQVENGHTLHLVARQPAQPQPSANTGSGDTTRDNSNQGNDASAGAPRNRIGQVSHSVVLGTFNVGDQGEGIVPDISRVIGAVLNSFGVGGQAATNNIGGMQSSNMSNVIGQASQGSETGGSHGNVGGQIPAGNQTQSGQPFQSAPQVVQVPLTAAIPVPSLHSPIPDSLNTLSDFITRMERVIAQNGNQPNTSATGMGDPPRVELPSNARGLPTAEALSIVLHHAERLLSGPTTTALSHIAGRLEQEVSSTDPSIRGQIQSESMQVGLAMQHLGALLLELGRTILTLRMGQSPEESSVNAGPAVYISPSGPNPIMVQPFPLQTNSLFGGPVPPSNPMAFGPVGIGNAPRHVNIHIHAGTSLASVIPTIGTRTSSTAMQGEQGNAAGLGVSGPEQVLPVRNVVAATVPLRSAGVTVAAQPGLGLSLSQPPSDSMPLSSIVNEINSQLRQLTGDGQGENQPASGSVGSGAGNNPTNLQTNSTVINGAGESSVSLPGVMSERHGQKTPGEQVQVHDNYPLSLKDTPSSSVDTSSSSVNPSSSLNMRSFSVECPNGETSLKSEDTSQNAYSSSSKHDVPDSTKVVPLGLGLGSLDRKRRTKQTKSPVGSGDSETTNTHLNQNPNTGISGLELLQCLASRSSGANRAGANDTPSDPVAPFAGQVMEGRPPRDLSSDGQLDAASAMSQVLDNPVMNNLLAGVSEQTGVGSPNVFRNMLQQLTQNPQIMNTVSQIAQQVDGQDLGNVFSSLGSGQGGGIDLSGMVRQMMPVVSQVLGHVSPTPQLFPIPEPGPLMQSNERELNRAENPNDQNIQVNLHEVAQRIEQFDAPQDVFQAIVGNAVRLDGDGSNAEDILHELNSNEDLAIDYVEMLQRDVRRRLQDDSGKDKC